MKSSILIKALFIIAIVKAHPDPIPGYEIEESIYYDTFPDGFLWGTATAAYQVRLNILIVMSLLFKSSQNRI